MGELDEKIGRLSEYVHSLGCVAVAFSGGVDSAFLLHVAFEALGSHCVAVTVSSVFVPESEQNAAASFCRSLGVRQFVLDFKPLDIPLIAENPKNRCYACKKSMFTLVQAAATQNGFGVVIDGTNVDDESDFRPGLAALRELGVKSPLAECGFTKEDIRSASKIRSLPEWNKPSAACLASRFAYGEPLTAENLRHVEKAESFLHGIGLSQLRVRVHKNLARIETLPCEAEIIFARKDDVHSALRKLGFDFVTLDLGGFKSGSMNV